MRRELVFAVLIILTVSMLGYHALAQIEPPSVFEIKGQTKMRIDESGVASVEEVLEFSASAFVNFKQTYNPLSTFVRELSPRSMPIQIDNLTINLDEANNKLTAKYKILGASVYMGGGKWMLKVGDPKKLTLSTSNGNTFVFTNAYAVGSNYKIMETITIELPQGAKNPTYDEDEGVITYELPLGSGPSSGSGALKYLGYALTGVGVIIIVASVIVSRKVSVTE